MFKMKKLKKFYKKSVTASGKQLLRDKSISSDVERINKVDVSNKLDTKLSQESDLIKSEIIETEKCLMECANAFDTNSRFKTIKTVSRIFSLIISLYKLISIHSLILRSIEFIRSGSVCLKCTVILAPPDCSLSLAFASSFFSFSNSASLSLPVLKADKQNTQQQSSKGQLKQKLRKLSYCLTNAQQQANLESIGGSKEIVEPLIAEPNKTSITNTIKSCWISRCIWQSFSRVINYFIPVALRINESRL